MTEWLRHSVANLGRSTCVGLNSVVGTIYHKPKTNPAVLPLRFVNDYSWVTLMTQVFMRQAHVS